MKRLLPSSYFLCLVLFLSFSQLLLIKKSNLTINRPTDIINILTNDNSTTIHNNDGAVNHSNDWLVARLSRPWKQRPLSTWCSNHTLHLVKVPKSASSTMAGVVLNLQRIHECSTIWQHDAVVPSRHTSVNDTASSSSTTSAVNIFRLAPIRRPDTRALSSVYFHRVSFHYKNKIPSDAFILSLLNQTQSNYITNYVQQSSSTESPVSTASLARIMLDYDFLLVTERLDESLVVFSWILQIPLWQVVVQSSKVSGQQYVFSQGRHCIPLIAPVVTAAVQEYFTSSRYWKQAHAVDYLLHDIANASLDKTIDEQMGRSLFEQELRRYRQMQEHAQRACRDQTVFPCNTDNSNPTIATSNAGLPTVTNCIERDFACGYQCIEDTLIDLV